jgi:ankyrin repeat protein
MLKRLLPGFFLSKKKRLIRAAEEGHLDLVQRILEAGADPDAKCEEGFTVLMWAVARGHVEVVQVLLEAGANPDVRSEKGRTAAEIAAQEGYDEIAGILREAASPG